MVAAALVMTDEQRAELERIAGAPSLPFRQVRQAKALLLAGDGVANAEIARCVQVEADTVRAWRRRFAENGVQKLGQVAAGRGRKPWLPEGTVTKVLELTCAGRPPGGATHWTTRSLAAQVGVSDDTVRRIWKGHGLQPWRVDVFKVSRDPDFEAKLRDVVGLYLRPPARAVVFSFDEKTSCQALDRAQPSLPMKRGRGGTMTHDYKRNGTIDVFAAMNLATGEVRTDLRKKHTGKDVLAFFKKIDAGVERGLSIHVILDNLSAHKAPEVRKWLAHKDRRRWHLHFIPTSSSWMNLVERWFKELDEKRLRRGVFSSLDDLCEGITDWKDHWNATATPYAWTAPADDILEKVNRSRDTLHRVISAADH